MDINFNYPMIGGEFTLAEARALVGRRVRSIIDFSGVPKGTTGTIVDYDSGPDAATIIIEWQFSERLYGLHKKPLRDWFTKYEYAKYLTFDGELLTEASSQAHQGPCENRASVPADEPGKPRHR